PLPDQHVQSVAAEVPHTLVRFTGGTVTPSPVVRIAVVGSEPSIAMRLAAAGSPEHRIVVVDATDPMCPVFRFQDPASPCANRPTPAERLLGTDGADVIVLALGPADRQVLNGISLQEVGSLRK